MSRPRLRPLLVREGARFACSGDGLCCTDAHLLGPVRAAERRALEARHPGSTTRTEGMVVLRAGPTGACGFLEAGGRCAIHHAPEKPRTCHRYPFLLVATPDGGRIGTDHRCPCRTMGARPVLDAATVEPSLRDARGRLESDRHVDADVPMALGVHLDWVSYRAAEAVLLGRLQAGERVEAVLASPPMPPFEGGGWEDVGRDLAEDDRPMRWSRANQWAGDALLGLHGHPVAPGRPRPWSDAFDRAQARSPVPRDPEAMLADWVADAIWTLEWAFRGPFTLARAELSTRAAMARWIAARIEAEGARPDRSMAEALLVVELVGLSDPWADLWARVRA